VVAAAKVAAAGVEAADASARAARQQVAQARGELAQMEANLRSARTGPQQVTVARSRSVSAEAALKNAGAMVEQARLNLGYTKVAAPVDGITGKKGVEIGQNVQPGQVLLYLVPVEDVWVTANFKENQLRKIRPGQHVTISVDAYHREYDGYVESIGAASGARFSLFPPENATGNYIKVVQRIPVRIRFSRGQDAKHLLRPGMSVVPKVRVK
jgi:membrane fusion protein, multidrug efflux system